ncbi:MAG TPA: protease complex subunit PrcB family protein, partial [bacterium]|nr:protease complex subunit PrcB family protein [bacterium]
LAAVPREKEKRAVKKSAKIEVAMDEIKPQAAQAPPAGTSAGVPSTALAFGGATTVSPPVEKQANEAGADYSTANTNLSAAQAPAAFPAVPGPTPISSWSGSFNPASSETQELITDAASFDKYWQTFQPGKTPPTVDFTTQAVVVLMDQERPTVGYSIHVSDLEDKTDQLVIHYKVEAPAPGSINAQVLTRPWALQIIPKPAKPVVFQRD